MVPAGCWHEEGPLTLQSPLEGGKRWGGDKKPLQAGEMKPRGLVRLLCGATNPVILCKQVTLGPQLALQLFLAVNS